MTPALAWLEQRRPAGPPSLEAAMRRRVSESATAAMAAPEGLAESGLAALRRVLAERSSRAHALELLVADALITHALEAAAGSGAAALDGVLERLAPGRLAALLPEET